MYPYAIQNLSRLDVSEMIAFFRFHSKKNLCTKSADSDTNVNLVPCDNWQAAFACFQQPFLHIQKTCGQARGTDTAWRMRQWDARGFYISTKHLMTFNVFNDYHLVCTPTHPCQCQCLASFCIPLWVRPRSRQTKSFPFTSKCALVGSHDPWI